MMTRALSAGAATVVVGVVAFGCRQSPGEQAAEVARQASTAATTSTQQQLWQDLGRNGGAPGLERVPIVENPIGQRTRATSGQRSSVVPSQPITSLPKGVQNTIRIVDYPSNPGSAHDGPATVIDVTGDRIAVDLGAKRVVSLLARVAGGPVRVTAGEAVRVAYFSRRNPQGQRSVIGIQNAAGAGIAHVTESRDDRIDTIIPLFAVNARQLGSEPAPPVRVTVGGSASRVLQPGETAQVGDVTVFLVGSAGVAPGTDLGQIEGKPYALNVMVWKVP